MQHLKTGLPSSVATKERALFTNASDAEFTFRMLEYGDFDKGFPEILKNLTEVGDSTKE